MDSESVQNLLNNQLATWELARNNYLALKQVRVKELDVNGTPYKVQFNPARIVSSSAKVDSKSIQERKCFLCPAHLPQEQKSILFKLHYNILVNPFPIFPKHLTIPEKEHVDQTIRSRYLDMLDLAACVGEYVIFYNGPKCGASAPDHAHFQAGSKGFLPIEENWKDGANKILEYNEATLWALKDSDRTALVIESPERWSAAELFDIVYDSMDVNPGEEEPMMNILTWVREEEEWVTCIFPREKHRPSCYSAEGDANILISPASVDLGGVFITPREEDYEKLTAADIAGILKEVCLNPTEFRQLIKRIKQHSI